MELLTLTIPTEAPSAHSWPRVRALASIPPPAAPGLRARWWRPAPGGLLARYLFDDADALEAFERSGRAADAELSGLAGLTGLAGARARRESIDEATIDTAFDRPVLVVCAPRTGSTMLADLLARSRDLWTAEGELQGIIDGIPGLDLPSRGHRSQVLDERDATPAIARTLRACLLAELRDHRGRRRLDLPVQQRPVGLRLLDKTVENALRLPFLLRVFPDAQLVLLWRDLRPNLSSMVEAWGSPGFVSIPSLPGWPGERWCFVLPEGWRERAGASPTQLAAFQWRSIHEAILDALEGLPRDRWTTVRYADLIADPGATARRLCRFMDVDAAGCSELAARGPLPPSPTMLSPPSPIKWRSNRAFDPAVAASLQPLAGRIRHLAAGAAAPVLRAGQPSRTRLACFVESLPAEPLPASARVSPSLVAQEGASIPLALARRALHRERFLGEHPMLWIEDPATGCLIPLWLRREHARLGRRLRPGEPPPADLDPKLAARLGHAGVLVDPEALARRRRAGDALVCEAGHALEHQRMGELPGLLPPVLLRALGAYYRELIAAGEWPLGDAQVERRHGWHNERVARFVHHQLRAFVSRVAGCELKPTYTYVSAYRGGAELHAHTDREQCDYTLSVAVDMTGPPGDPSWPLWFSCPSGPVMVTPGVGDGVLFRGCELPHWRGTASAEHAQINLLFHYVPAEWDGVLD